MPVAEKRQQILAKEETSDGVSSSPSASDAVQVYDVSIEDAPEVEENRPAGPTLSPAKVAIGRRTRRLQFKTNWEGSADATIPVTDPSWMRFLLACSFGRSAIRKLTMGAVTGSGFQVGEEITQSAGAIRAVVLGGFTVGGVLVDRMTSNGGHLAVVELVGTLTAAATTGASSGSTSTASAVAAYEGVGAQPTSQQLIRVTTGAWSAGAPVLGEVLRVEDATTAVLLGVATVVIDNSAGAFTDIEVKRVWGAIANGNKLVRAGGSNATISAPPTQSKCPSLTITRNLDGRRKELLGSRGDFSLAADAGKRGQFSWSMTADPGATIDTPAVTTSPLGSVTSPRLLGAIFGAGVGADLHRPSIKSYSLEMGNTVAADIDGNRAGGSYGSFVSDRAPRFRGVWNNTQGVPDWESLRDNQTPVRVALLKGTAKGNIVGIVIPNGQVLEANESGQDGIATYDVVIQPNRVLESGDDELFVFQL